MMELNLKPLQKVALDACRDACRSSRRFILKANCGFGKTILSTYFIKKAMSKGLSCLFVVDRIVLAEQTSLVFENYGIAHGIIQADNPKYFPDRMVQIGSIQTLARRQQDKYGLVLIDEIHCFYEGHKKLLEYNSDAFVIGLSATPYSKNLGKYFDFFIEPVTVKEMVEHDELVPFEIYAPSVADLTKLKIKAGEYTEKSLSDTYDQVDIVGDVVRTWQKLANGLKTIIFGVNIAHIKHLAREFNRAGVKACEIDAYQSKNENEKNINAFKFGDMMVLCSVEMAIKGFDCPSVECVGLAVATKSHIKWEQSTGRGFRVYPGKKKCKVLDFGGNAERLGFPDEYEFLELDTGKKYLSKTKQKEKAEKKPKKCVSCDYIKPPGVRKCPACGFLPEFIEDVDTSDAELKKIKRKARAEYSLAEKQSFLAQLNFYAEQKNYKAGRSGCYGWALHKYKEKFGSQPSNKLDWSKKEPVQEEVRKYIISRNIAYAKRRR